MRVPCKPDEYNLRDIRGPMRIAINPPQRGRIHESDVTAHELGKRILRLFVGVPLEQGGVFDHPSTSVTELEAGQQSREYPSDRARHRMTSRGGHDDVGPTGQASVARSLVGAARHRDNVAAETRRYLLSESSDSCRDRVDRGAAASGPRSIKPCVRSQSGVEMGPRCPHRGGFELNAVRTPRLHFRADCDVIATKSCKKSRGDAHLHRAPM